MKSDIYVNLPSSKKYIYTPRCRKKNTAIGLVKRFGRLAKQTFSSPNQAGETLPVKIIIIVKVILRLTC